MGSDARVRYTKMIIKVNFIELLGKKPINLRPRGNKPSYFL